MLCSWSKDSIVVASAKAPSSVLASVNVPFEPPTVLKQSFGYENACVRKLLNETHGIFVRFIDAVKGTDPKTINAIILQTASVDFRVSIRACCQGLERALAELNEPNAAGAGADRNQKIRKLEGLLLLYRHVEVIWSLCDVLFFRPQGEVLVSDLLEWSRWNFTEPDDMVKEMLDWQRGNGISPSTNRLERHEKYWNTVYAFLLTGRVEEARKLLKAHSRASIDQALISMEEVLRTFPLSRLPTQVPTKSDIIAWQEETKRRFESGIFMAVPELETVAEILLGNNETFRRLLPLCSWYQVVVGCTLFTHPFAKIYDLHSISEECIDLASSSQVSWSSLDKILLSFFELQILNALKEICFSFRNWWCAAHLGLLLWHGGCTELFTTKENVVDLREYLLFEYGESLMSCGGSLWHIGVDYLAACPTYGINALRLCLERIALGTKDHQKTFKLLEICRKYDLHDTAKSICKEKSINALKCGRLADALTWSFQAKDTQFATYIAEQLLHLHGKTAALRDLALLDNLGETTLISPSVTFLCKYRQASVLMEREQWKECANILTELISSRIAPRSFWMVLFSDVMDLLNAADGEIIFDTNQTYRIMDALESMILDIDHIKNRNYSSDQQEENGLSKNVKELRLALVKNLSNSLLQRREIVA